MIGGKIQFKKDSNCQSSPSMTEYNSSFDVNSWFLEVGKPDES